MKNDVNENGAGGGFWNAAGIFIGRLRIAFRGLWKNQVITVSAIISIALGIGASTAMFTIYDEYLLRPLPVPNAGRLVNFSAPGPKPGSHAPDIVTGGMDEIFSYPMFHDLEKAHRVFTNIAAHRTTSYIITWRGTGDRQPAKLVSGEYFSALGLKPVIGRLLTPDDGKAAGEALVAVLSYDYWQSRFGGDPDVLNQVITINNTQPTTIVGVAPKGFTGTTLGAPARIFIPIPTFTGVGYLDNRSYYWLNVFGCLKPGVTLEQAAAAINVQYHNIINEYDAPSIEQMVGANNPIMQQFREKQLILKQGSRGQSIVPETNGERLRTRMGSALLLLIIACMNITNLLVVRGMARTGEIALRVSIGATRGQIIRQLLSESFILVFIAGAAGVLAAHWILRFIASMYPSSATAVFSFSMNETALLFAVIMTFAVGVLVGLFPAFHGARNDVTPLLKEQAGQTTGSKSAARVRAALIVAQIALSLTLLMVSGLFAKNFYKIINTDIGMNTNNIAIFSVQPSDNGYTPQRAAQFIERLEEELAATPGVVSVTSSNMLMFHLESLSNTVNVEGAISDLGKNLRIELAGANYLRTFNTQLIAGRDFTDADIHGTGKKAVIANEAFAELFNLGRDVVGKHVSLPTGGSLDYEIVGLAKNARYTNILEEPQPFLFVPYTRAESAFGTIGVRSRVFYVKTALPEESVLPQLRGLVSRIDPAFPVENMTTMTQIIRDNTSNARLSYTLAVAGACMAMLLTAVGLYGIFAHDVARRRREIGLRMALGATRGRLCLMFLSRAALITLTGCVIGLGLSIFAVKQIQSQLYKFEGFDTGMFIGAAALLFVIMMLAVLIPVRRAVVAEPLESLRTE